MVALNRFWTLTPPIPSFFHDPHFGSAFVFYLIGISGKQLDVVDWIDERLGSFSLAWREISLLDSPQLEHNPRRWSRSCPDSAGALCFAVPDLGFVTVSATTLVSDSVYWNRD
jgi:hypothetical protein